MRQWCSGPASWSLAYKMSQNTLIWCLNHRKKPPQNTTILSLCSPLQQTRTKSLSPSRSNPNPKNKSRSLSFSKRKYNCLLLKSIRKKASCPRLCHPLCTFRTLKKMPKKKHRQKKNKQGISSVNSSLTKTQLSMSHNPLSNKQKRRPHLLTSFK